MTASAHAVAGALARVRCEVDAAARAAGRDPSEVRIVAVSKYATAAAVIAAADAGQRDFGENYVQQGTAKIDAVARDDLRWHFIGALQSNKAARAAQRFHLIHTVASDSVLGPIARAAAERGAPCRVLLQIRLGGGAARAGVDGAGAERLARAAARTGRIVVDGVMGLAPLGEPARPHFARLREVLERLRALAIEGAPLREMSAGMSGDFADAIAEGSTLVRIGRAIFAPEREES
jgi:pyridoxal phosphate enzyme (YggS family)